MINCESCGKKLPPEEECYAMCEPCEKLDDVKKSVALTIETKGHHSKRSPSSLKNLENCPHYWQDDNKEPHPNTVAGSRVHLAVELYYNPKKEFSLEGEDIEFFRDLADDEYERADKCIAYVSEIVKETWGLDMEEQLALPPSKRAFAMHVEPRLYTQHPDTYGRCDLVLIHKTNKQALLFDWKDGWGYQGDANHNPQGQAYSLGLMLGYDVDLVILHFYYSRRNESTEASFPTKMFKVKFEKRIQAINDNCDRAEAGEQLHQRGPQCDFCDEQVKCPEWADDIPIIVAQSKIPEMSPHLPKHWDLDYLEEHPAEMSKAMFALTFLEKYLKVLKQNARDLAVDEDIDFPGFSVVNSNSGIKCSDPDGIYQVAVVGRKLPVEEFHDCIKTITVAKVVKKLAVHTHEELGMTIAAADRHWRSHLLSAGIISEGTPYSYLKKSND